MSDGTAVGGGAWEVDVTATGIRGRPSAAAAPARPSGPRPLVGLQALLEDLERSGVAYCAWKSNHHLAEALAGETDLDLLVDRRHAAGLAEVLGRHHVRRLEPSPGGRHPGVEHHLGLDRDTARLFHLHVHFLVVLGERHVKNVVLPMEEQFLGARRWMSGVRLPDPAVELAVLALRAMLKVRARDVVKDTLRVRTHGIPAPIRAEVRWLLEQTSTVEVRRVCGEARLGELADVVVALLHLVEQDTRDGVALWRLRGRTRRLLRSHARRSRAGVVAETLRVAWARRRWRLDGAPRRRMTPAVGGAVVALVGPDGAGKSTLADDLDTWLGWKLDVLGLYLGSKQPSRRSRAVHLAFRALRRASRAAERRSAALGAWLGDLRDVALAVHCLAIARDRTRRHRRARLAARAGRVVVLDRFPVASCTGSWRQRILDGPRIDVLLPDAGEVVARLARTERRAYTRLRAPDLVVALQVDPGIAAARKPDHDPEVVARKARAVDELVARPGPLRVVGVRTDRDLDEVRRTVRQVVWDGI